MVKRKSYDVLREIVWHLGLGYCKGRWHSINSLSRRSKMDWLVCRKGLECLKDLNVVEEKQEGNGRYFRIKKKEDE